MVALLMAKPSLFTEELFEEMLDLHAGCGVTEPMTIEDICRMPGKPKTRTFYEWIENRPDLEKRFRAARKVAMDGIAAVILRIADEQIMGETVEIERLPKPRPPGADKDAPIEYEEVIVKRTRKEMLEHRKLRIDSRLKLLAKWDTRYADRVRAELSGSLNISRTVRDLSDEQLARIAAGEEVGQAGG